MPPLQRPQLVRAGLARRQLGTPDGVIAPDVHAETAFFLRLPFRLLGFAGLGLGLAVGLAQSMFDAGGIAPVPAQGPLAQGVRLHTVMPQGIAPVAGGAETPGLPALAVARSGLARRGLHRLALLHRQHRQGSKGDRQGRQGQTSQKQMYSMQHGRRIAVIPPDCKDIPVAGHPLCPHAAP